ncbi:MAG: hypothetical protein U0469_02540 [Candidatus Paceibacterota bacterium]
MSLFSKLNKKTPNLFPSPESIDKKLETKKQTENIIKASIEALKTKSKSAFEALKNFLKKATPEVADNLRKIGKPALAASIAMLSMKGVDAQKSSPVEDVPIGSIMKKEGKSKGVVVNKDNTATLISINHKGKKIKIKEGGTYEVLNKNDQNNIEDNNNDGQDTVINQPYQKQEKKSGNIVEFDGKQYEPYHGSVAPKNPDGTIKPGFRLFNNNWYHVVGESVTEKNTDEKFILIDGKKYEIFYPTSDEHPTDTNGNVKSNYKYQNKNWYKLVGSVSSDNSNLPGETKTNIKRKKGDPLGSNYSNNIERDTNNEKWVPFYITPNERPLDAQGKIKDGYRKTASGGWEKRVS